MITKNLRKELEDEDVKALLVLVKPWLVRERMAEIRGWVDTLEFENSPPKERIKYILNKILSWIYV